MIDENNIQEKKTVLVSKYTQIDLAQLKLDKGIKTMNDAIRYLLEFEFYHNTDMLKHDREIAKKKWDSYHKDNHEVMNNQNKKPEVV